MKQQFVVTHTVRQTEILALLDSRVTNTPSDKIAYLYSFVRTTCLRVHLLRACPIFFLSLQLITGVLRKLPVSWAICNGGK